MQTESIIQFSLVYFRTLIKPSGQLWDDFADMVDNGFVKEDCAWREAEGVLPQTRDRRTLLTADSRCCYLVISE
jgi:hypothetical protein